MVHTKCAVRGCKSSSHINKELRFHQFPHTEERCNLWIKKCARSDLNGKSSDTLKNKHICSLHFARDMYGKRSLKKTAVPTLLLPTNTRSVHTNTDSKGVRAVVGRFLGNVLQYSSMAGSINFNSRHLKGDDPLPPFSGKPRVYNMRFCPFAQRLILAMNAKKIDYEVVNVHLKDKPKWLFSKSAFGKVPSLELEEGVTVCESLVSVEYADEMFPQRPLLPKDPLKKAFEKIIVESTGPIQSIYIKAILFPDAVTDEMITAFHKALGFIEDQLKSRGTKFLGGSEPGFADYMIWPWFERLLTFDQDSIASIDRQKFSLLSQYMDDMLKDPAVTQYLIPKEIFDKFHQSYKTGNPEYELLNN